MVITGGRISGFRKGLRFDYMNNSRIEQMVVSDNNDEGIYLWGFTASATGTLYKKTESARMWSGESISNLLTETGLKPTTCGARRE